MTNQRYKNTYIDGYCHFCTASIYGFKPVLDDGDARRIINTGESVGEQEPCGSP
jgi:hypothetical protein